jgi:hypothetical protein
MLGEGVLQPAAVATPAFSGVKVRSADSGEWLSTNYVPRGSNRLY